MDEFVRNTEKRKKKLSLLYESVKKSVDLTCDPCANDGYSALIAIQELLKILKEEG